MSKTVRFLLGGCIALVLLLGTFSGGLMVGWFLPHNNPIASARFEPQDSDGGAQAPTAVASQNIDVLFAPFWEAWEIVHNQFVDQPVDDLALMRGAIRGMLEALGDQHTSYMDPDEFEQANAPMNGEYEGIGAYVDTTGEYLTIISPRPPPA